MFDKLKGNLNKIKNDIINEAKDIKSDIINEYNNEKDNLNKEFNNAKAEAKTGLAEVKFNKSDVEFIVDTVTFDGASKVVNAFDKSNIFDKSAKKLTETATKLSDNISENDVNFFKEISREKKLNNKKELNILNNMISENLNSLIEFALADGELSEKEKQILFKKAESEGIDLDEFEMILEAKLFQTKQTQTPQKNVENIDVAPKSDKFGDIKKCPSCGAIVESFSTKCTDCSYSFSNISANNSVQKLFEMINELESKRGDEETNPIKAFGAVLSKSFGVSIGDRINNQKKELISNFPIPNTRNDILEFLTLALPKARKAGNFFTSGNFNSPANDRNKIHNEFVPVWKNKCEQIIMKARFSMKEDKKTLEEIEFYAQQIGIK